jgi:hypothetical protein
MSTGKEYIVEEREAGEWAVIAVGGKKASAIETTEAKGIKLPRSLTLRTNPHSQGERRKARAVSQMMVSRHLPRIAMTQSLRRAGNSHSVALRCRAVRTSLSEPTKTTSSGLPSMFYAS